MNRSRRSRLPRLFLAGSVVATSTLLSILSPALSPSVNAALQDSPKVVIDEAWQIVNREYVDETFNQQDWIAVRQELLSREYGNQEEAYKALREALETLDDPYTRFMDPEQYQQLTAQTSGELSGIGIRLKLDRPTQTLIVEEALEGSPAIEAGVRTGDRVLAIDGQSTEGMSVEQASELIRGEVGTEVSLQVSRNGLHEQTIAIVRDLIQVPTVHYALKQESANSVGYIRLNEFSAHAAEQMQHAIQTLKQQGAEGFVLDLRGNPGGLLRSSIEISRMWLQDGAIVKTIDREGDSEEIKADGSALTNLPLAVLVDGDSASSSEILTGALQDNGRATIVGSRTFGKALVQSVHSLSDGSGLAVTVAHYYTPNGTDISQHGIDPDIEVDLTGNERRLLASEPTLIGSADADPQYRQAISALASTIVANRQNAAPGVPAITPRLAELGSVGATSERY